MVPATSTDGMRRGENNRSVHEAVKKKRKQTSSNPAHRQPTPVSISATNAAETVMP